MCDECECDSGVCRNREDGAGEVAPGAGEGGGGETEEVGREEKSGEDVGGCLRGRQRRHHCCSQRGEFTHPTPLFTPGGGLCFQLYSSYRHSIRP